MYYSYFAFYCIKQRYLAHSIDKFPGFIDLIKRVYPVPCCRKTPRKATLMRLWYCHRYARSRTFSSSWISPKTFRPMKQTESRSSLLPLHVGRQAPKLEPSALVSSAFTTLVVVPANSICFLGETIN